MDKCLSIDEATSLVAAKYFPRERNLTAKMNLSGLTYFLASFIGETINSDTYSTIGDFFNSLKTSPIRIYLHTELKTSLPVDSSDDDLPSINRQPSINHRTTAPNRDEKDRLYRADFGEKRYLLRKIVARNILKIEEPTGSTSNTEESFEEAGTPAMQRRALKKQNRRIQTDDGESRCETATVRNTSVCSKSVIEICDSEDEEISRAIEASLNDSQSLQIIVLCLVHLKNEESSIEQVIKDFHVAAVNKDVRINVIVSQSRVLDSAFLGICRKSFNLKGQLYVKFSGEDGQDHGGQRREFLCPRREAYSF
ncbi:uncharacterized protein LOC123530785 [Mercenaria mercenaria]|uniref:uncharacterized protein LOC123530785 n=1 Tax=Mercenaria mercenaria TaxID=6596 RepID=UPI00234EDCDE|nr:uncharacterized protein LOC123530785 [Mercenaria mercenaria]